MIFINDAEKNPALTIQFFKHRFIEQVKSSEIREMQQSRFTDKM